MILFYTLCRVCLEVITQDKAVLQKFNSEKVKQQRTEYLVHENIFADESIIPSSSEPQEQ